jgi:hypothetical protein
VVNENGRNRDYVYVDVKSRGESSSSNNEANNSDNNNNNNNNRNEESQQNNANENTESQTNSSKNVKKPLVLIKPLTNGRQIQVGQELKIACLVSGNFYLI